VHSHADDPWPPHIGNRELVADLGKDHVRRESSSGGVRRDCGMGCENCRVQAPLPRIRGTDERVDTGSNARQHAPIDEPADTLLADTGVCQLLPSHQRPLAGEHVFHVCESRFHGGAT
jgi:hypothetical protein